MTSSMRRSPFSILNTLATFGTAAGILSACGVEPAVPEQPTWADVEPILRRNCNHCHGSTAPVTASAGTAVYRFDFFDPTDGACGEATAAFSSSAMAMASASQMKASIESVDGARPRMPPAPAPLLPAWERETIKRWSHASSLPKGAVPWNNRQPRLQVLRFPAPDAGVAQVDQLLGFNVVLSDPDGDPVVGIIKAAGSVVKLDRSGLFAVSLDTSTWAPGTTTLQAVLCDGWGNVSYNVGTVEIKHAPP